MLPPPWKPHSERESPLPLAAPPTTSVHEGKRSMRSCSWQRAGGFWADTANPEPPPLQDRYTTPAPAHQRVPRPEGTSDQEASVVEWSGVLGMREQGTGDLASGRGEEEEGTGESVSGRGLLPRRTGSDVWVTTSV